jgi:hypothetical protein
MFLRHSDDDNLHCLKICLKYAAVTLGSKMSRRRGPQEVQEEVQEEEEEEEEEEG